MIVVLPTFGRERMTHNFIRKHEELFPGTRYVIVDDHPDHPHRNVPFQSDVTIDILPGNGSLWWGGSVNLALEYLEGLSIKDEEVVILANNDAVPDASLKILHDSRKSKELLHPRVIDLDGRELAAGKRILSWIPFVTAAPLRAASRRPADFLQARYLVGDWENFRRLGKVPRGIPQYQGDYWISQSARRKGWEVGVFQPAFCLVDESDTGAKNTNMQTAGEFLRSLISIRSANNVLYRYRFTREFIGALPAIFAVSSMTLNSAVRTILNRIRK